ncbi:MAG: DNA-3-methyladenine glycosylase 2 family protein [bacterium]|nr:DNA-3-methyladenine glycosylase 2 family protein [bacterium]
MIETTFTLSRPYDLRRSLRFVLPKSTQLVRLDDQECSFAHETSTGAATVVVRRDQDQLLVTAMGPGAEAAVQALPGTLGLDDDPSDFVAGDGFMGGLHRRHRGLRLGHTGRVFDAVLPVVIGQRVTTDEANASYRRLVAATAEPAPGDLGLFLPPRPERLATMSYEDLHPFGLERGRAQIIIELARRARRLEEIVGMNRHDAIRRLSAVKGIGPWTTAQVMATAWGDRDAVPTGDFHLPNIVAWALAHEPRADDERMLELLEPYRPLRRRAYVLIKLSGIHAPRYGARTPKSTISG